METTLAEFEKNYRMLFENNPIGLYRTSVDGRVLAANPALVELFGFPDEEFMLAVNVKDLYAHPDHVAEFNSTIEQSDIVSNFKSEFRRRDGTTFWAEDNVRIVRDDKGSILFYEGSLLDITERKRSEERLRRSEAHLEEAQRIAHLGSWEWIAETDTPTWSKELCSILEVDPDKPVPKLADQHRLYTPDSMVRMNAAVEKTMQTGAPYEIELERVREDGSHRWLLARGERWFDKKGQLIGLRGTALDITEGKRSEEALNRRAQELQTLYQTSLEINAQADLDSLLRAIVQRAASLVRVESGGLYLMPLDGQNLKLEVGQNLSEQYLGTTLKLGESLSGKAAQSGEIIVVEDYQEWDGRVNLRRHLLPPRTGSSAESQGQSDRCAQYYRSYAPRFILRGKLLVSLFADQAAPLGIL